MGGGPRAAEWATRFLAAGLDVVVDDPTVVDVVRDSWPAAQRLGLFPGADLARLTVVEPRRASRRRELVQVVGTATRPPARGWSPPTTPLVAARRSTCVPLVEVADGPTATRWPPFYTSHRHDTVSARRRPTAARWRLGPALVELTDGDPDAIIASCARCARRGIGAGEAIAAPRGPALRVGRRAAVATRRRRRRAARAVRHPVEPDWVDYNGHMTEAAYLTAAGWASDALFRYIGDDEAYRAAGHSFYTVETHIHYLLEVVGARADRTSPRRCSASTPSACTCVHSMYHGDTGTLLCTAEQMLVHVDMNAGRSAPILPHVAAALARHRATRTRTLPVPPQVGSVMRLPPPR